MGKRKLYIQIPTSGGTTLERCDPQHFVNVGMILWILISLVIIGVTVAIGIITKLDCEIQPLLLSCGGLMVSMLLSVIAFICCTTCCKDSGVGKCCVILVIFTVLGALFATMFFTYKNYSTVSTERHHTNPQVSSTVTPNYSTVAGNYSTMTPNYSTVTPNYSTLNQNYSTFTPNKSTEIPDVNMELETASAKDPPNYCDHLLYYYIFWMVTMLAVCTFLCPICCCCVGVCCCGE